MKKFLVRVCETINHDYEVWAESIEDAEYKFLNMSHYDRINNDLYGGEGGHWDTPWEIEELPVMDGEVD